MDLYASADITVADVENGIDAMVTKYGAEATATHASMHGWQREKDLVFIEHFADGSSSATWTPVPLRSPAFQGGELHFNNDASSNPSAYSKEIGAMDVRSNYSKANYP